MNNALLSDDPQSFHHIDHDEDRFGEGETFGWRLNKLVERFDRVKKLHEDRVFELKIWISTFIVLGEKHGLSFC